MLLEKERILVVEYGKKLVSSRLTRGTGGNLSVINREQNLIAIGPSGMDYFDVTPEDVCVVTPVGEVREGKRKPSSELSLHLLIYERRPEFSAVIHSHAAYATAVSCLNIDLPPVHYMTALSGEKEVTCAKYALFGTRELAENVLSAMEGKSAALMANHGMVAAAETMAGAFEITDEIEFCAKLYCVCKAAGSPVFLSDPQMEEVLEKFKTYGQ